MTFQDYETPLVTLCLDEIAVWAAPKIEALRKAEMSSEAAEHVREIIIALTVEIDAHMHASILMSDDPDC